MDEKTLTALKQSIEKWEKRAAGDHTLPLGMIACPLCMLYIIPSGSCDGCPIYEKTGEECCTNTPYLGYVDSQTNANAQKELDFLRGLLPPEEKKQEFKFKWVDLRGF